MRVLVCGGRDYRNRRAVDLMLSGIHSRDGIDAIIQGGARGADTLAAEWGFDHDVPVGTYNADWKAHGKAAGPIRNQKMLDEGKPDLVVAFPGGKGTADMVRRAKDAGVKVLQIHAPGVGR